jgi:hypothetical protein
LFVFNLLVLIGGLAIAIIGIVAVASDDYYRFSDFEDNNLFRSAAFIQIVVGFMVTLFAFLGCCGAIKESKTLLYTYAVLTSIVFILLLVAGILAIVYKSDARDLMRDSLRKRMGSYKQEEASQKSWDTLQTGGKCCGIDNAADWTTYGGFAAGDVPNSCCISDATCSAASGSYQKGCLDLIDDVLSFSTTLSWVAIVIGIIMLLAVILSFCVGCAL